MMALGTEGNGRGFKMQMHFEAQVQFFFFFHLDYTNDFLQTVDTYGHHHHWSSYCSARKQQARDGPDGASQAPGMVFLIYLFKFYFFSSSLLFAHASHNYVAPPPSG